MDTSATKRTLGTDFTRRGILGAAALLPLAGCATTKLTGQAIAMQDDVRRYTDFGWHRAGWPADTLTRGWMTERFERMGYNVIDDPFEVDTLTIAEADLSIGDTPVECALQWAPASSKNQITAPLVAAEDTVKLAGAIGVMTTPAPASAYWNEKGDALISKVAAGGAKALILAADSPAPAPFLFNRAAVPSLAIPVIVIARDQLSTFAEATQTGARATLAWHAKVERAQTSNLTAELKGVPSTLRISTPMTGWFACGAERGPGVAIMLALAAILRDREIPVSFEASGAHELGHAGMDRILERTAGQAQETRLWIHLGSSIGVPRPAFIPSVYATPDVRSDVDSAYSGLPCAISTAEGNAPGETGAIIRAGYGRVIGFAGPNTEFHTRLDDARSVDFALLEAILGATVNLIHSAINRHEA